MGYRLVLRKFTYPEGVHAGGKLSFTSWWENKGVAPCSHNFPFALKVTRNGTTMVLVMNPDVRTWLPGDSLYDDAVFVPADIPPGEYEFSVGIVDRQTRVPIVRLAISNRDSAGRYPLGRITASTHGTTSK